MKEEEYREGDDWNESTDVGDVTTISRIAARPDIVVVVVDDVLRDVMAFPPTNEGCDDSCVGVVLIFFFLRRSPRLGRPLICAVAVDGYTVWIWNG